MKRLLTALLMAPALAFAQAGYKCVDPNGKVTYTEFGCSGNQTFQGKFNANPPRGKWADERQDSLFFHYLERGDAAMAITYARTQQHKALIGPYMANLRAQQQAAEAQQQAAIAEQQARAAQAQREQALIDATNRAAAAAQQAAADAEARRSKPMNCVGDFGSYTCFPGR